MKRPPWPLMAAAAIVTALALTPLVYIAMRASGAGSEGWSIFARASVWRVFGHSTLLALIVTVGSVALGVPIAWLTVRTDLPLRRFWSAALVLPLAMPSYISAYTMIALLGPSGMLARALGLERMPEIYGLPGTALVITLITYPFVALGVRAALHRMNPALDEAARGLGCGPWRRFWRVTLPLLRPSLASGGLLAALYALSDFGSPALMQYNTFTRVIYTQYTSSFNRDRAALTALLLVVLTFLILGIESVTRGRARFHSVAPSTERPFPIFPLGRWRWPAFGFCAAVLGGALGVPVFVMIYWIARGLRHGQSLHLSFEQIASSVLAGLLAAGAAVLAALPVVYLAVRYRGRLVALVDRAAYAGQALPGIVIALSLVFFGARFLQPIGLYQTLPVLIFAYVIRFLPEALGCMRTSLLQVNPRLEEAARSLGRSRLSTLFSVTLPLLMPGILAGAALVFLTTIKELPVTLLLSPTGFETLVTQIWDSASEGLFSQASPPALLLVVVSALSVTVILRQEGRIKYG